ncbi:hypothetical protein HNY73_017738 [Argiope bruennichi]|uniref:Uncharacterized protein n=1 Tax=Argiope bruennichi TaxID=94029 RepID=A0A8T0EDS9_ARGBR|nr:hypothetical protein HNY73_017738 [Argiope bruennichi]
MKIKTINCSKTLEIAPSTPTPLLSQILRFCNVERETLCANSLIHQYLSLFSAIEFCKETSRIWSSKKQSPSNIKATMR